MNRRTWLTRLCVVAVFAATSAGSVMGQIRGTQLYDVPFAFLVGHVACPAGEYTVTSSSTGVLKLTHRSTSKSIFVLARVEPGSKTANETKLVFHRYGDTRFLNQIRSEGESSYVQLGRSDEERDVARRWTESSETVLAGLRP